MQHRMTTIRFSGRVPSPQSLTLGMETDSNVDTLEFELPEIADVQVATLQMILPDGTADLLLIEDGRTVIPGRILEIEGTVRAWVGILGTNARAWHSELLYLGIGDTPEISERTVQQYPTALQDTIAQTTENRRKAYPPEGIRSTISFSTRRPLRRAGKRRKPRSVVIKKSI